MSIRENLKQSKCENAQSCLAKWSSSRQIHNATGGRASWRADVAPARVSIHSARSPAALWMGPHSSLLKKYPSNLPLDLKNKKERKRWCLLQDLHPVSYQTSTALLVTVKKRYNDWLGAAWDISNSSLVKTPRTQAYPPFANYFPRKS